MALDIPFLLFTAHADAYVDSFTGALARTLGVQVATLAVTEYQASSVGTTLIYFDTILTGTDDSSSAVTLAFSAQVRSLFQPGSTSVGVPALPALLSELLATGLPMSNAFLQDQLVPTSGVTSAGGAGMASWSKSDSNEVLALDIPFASFLPSQAFYSAAFIAALSSLLSVPAETIHVNLFQASTAGTTLIFFSRLLDGAPSTSSDVVLSAFAEITAFFGPTPAVGAPALPAVVEAMQAFGLPLSALYYQDQT